MPPVLVAVLFGFAGVLLMGLAQPLVRREVRPNRLVGFRIAATFADPVVWYDANAAVGRAVFRLGAAITVGALALPWWMHAWAVAVLLPALLVGLLGIAAWGSLRASRLLAARTRDGTVGPAV